MKLHTKTALRAAILGTIMLPATNALSADQELLDILLANGSITKAQHVDLSKKASKDSAKTEKIMKKMAWAGKIKVKGDLRLRHEDVSDDGGAGDNRQRYRARVGVYADVTDSLKAGVRLVSAGSATSTNETLGDGFVNDSVYFDLAYMNWEVIDGVELIGGKFKKPWQTVSGGLVWDGDTNPEGIAVRYTGKMGGSKVILSGGHLVLDDVDDLSFSDDQRLFFIQAAAKFKSGSLKGKVGASLYDYDENDQTGTLITGRGNDATEYSIVDVFGEVGTGPFKVYAHLAHNQDADGPNSDEDTAYLIGAAFKSGKFTGSVDYRETEANAVNSAFNDSDFAGGRTDSDGFRIKLGYKIDKNFSAGLTYIASEAERLAGNDRNIDILQVDLKAKF